jgi:hypothetical protein
LSVPLLPDGEKPVPTLTAPELPATETAPDPKATKPLLPESAGPEDTETAPEALMPPTPVVITMVPELPLDKESAVVRLRAPDPEEKPSPVEICT